MAKLNKMELQAVAGSILKEVKAVKLPQLIQEWEQKKLEVESTEVYKDLQAWLKKHSLEEEPVINTFQLNRLLGLNPKPTSVNLPSVQSIVDKLIIGQITDSNITSLAESIAQELLNA